MTIFKFHITLVISITLYTPAEVLLLVLVTVDQCSWSVFLKMQSLQVFVSNMPFVQTGGRISRKRIIVEITASKPRDSWYYYLLNGPLLTIIIKSQCWIQIQINENEE